MAEPTPPEPEDAPQIEGAAAPVEPPKSEGEPEVASVIEADEPPLALDPQPGHRKRGFWRHARQLVTVCVLIVLLAPVAGVLVYRFLPPPLTFLMVQRLLEGRGLDHRWRPLYRISPNLTRAVIAAEDAGFCDHHGFDFTAMQKALANNEKRPSRIRGGSTISQQTAKNVFLWPDRSYVRKGLEAYYTLLIEGLWGKRRIMEVYLNSVEWGPGVYGAEAAAHKWFGVSADKLSGAQAARLAAILPSPLKWKAAAPGPYVKRRSSRIGAASGTVRRDGLAACVG
jgi:monofunctional biosynthetic peptidoglycan transglycosylase